MDDDDERETVSWDIELEKIRVGLFLSMSSREATLLFIGPPETVTFVRQGNF